MDLATVIALVNVLAIIGLYLFRSGQWKKERELEHVIEQLRGQIETMGAERKLLVGESDRRHDETSRRLERVERKIWPNGPRESRP